ncbi:MAG: hypothetical protein ACC726_16125 [Chloroflexota bacterium]
MPTLLDRPGERMALSNATDNVWSSVMPLVLMELRKSRRADREVTSPRPALHRLTDVVGQHTVYLDVLSPKDRPSDVTSDQLAEVYDDARRVGLEFIPVHTLGMSGSKTAAARLASEQDQGLLLRYRALEPHLPLRPRTDLLYIEVDALGIQPPDIDLLVDLGWWSYESELDSSHMRDVLADCAAAGPWRTVTLAGTSIPHTLAGFAVDSITPIERREWALWEQVVDDSGEAVRFGDYAIQHPRWPHSGGFGPFANIRYSIERGTLVARGNGRVNLLPVAEREDQYRALCQAIMAEPTFAGGYCCWGDEAIEACAQGRIQPSASTAFWRAVGTAHHMRMVTLAISIAEDVRASALQAPAQASREVAGEAAALVR